jgi:hypothetical protein
MVAMQEGDVVVVVGVWGRSVVRMKKNGVAYVVAGGLLGRGVEGGG